MGPLIVGQCHALLAREMFGKLKREKGMIRLTKTERVLFGHVTETNEKMFR